VQTTEIYSAALQQRSIVAYVQVVTSVPSSLDLILESGEAVLARLPCSSGPHL